MMHRITTVYWIPGCKLHRAGSPSSYYFAVALHVDVVTLKILAYTLVFREGCDGFSKPALIDLKYPNRFWLWQAYRRDLKEQKALVIPTKAVTWLDFDSFGPLRVVRKLPPAKVALLTNRLMKAFYDLSLWHLGYLYNPIRTTSAQLFQRIDRAIECANGFSAPRAN